MVVTGSAVFSNINVLLETFQSDRLTVWVRPSVFNIIIDKYVENIYTLKNLENIDNIKDLPLIRESRCTLFKISEINVLLVF